MGVIQRPIVSYTGSITDMHGLWRVADNNGGRYTLKSNHGLTLRYVRPTSVTIVTTPKLTTHRAEALRRIANGRPGGVDTRTLNWLLAQELVQREEDEDGRIKCTELGWEMAGALEIHYW